MNFVDAPALMNFVDAPATLTLALGSRVPQSYETAGKGGTVTIYTPTVVLLRGKRYLCFLIRPFLLLVSSKVDEDL